IFYEQGLYVIADGIGGHNAGDLASQTSIDLLEEWFSQDSSFSKLSIEDTGERLRERFIEINSLIYEYGMSSREYFGMGTTLSALAFRGEQWTICHVGDTRVYLLRRGRLIQLTHDHTVARSMVAKGQLTDAEARNTRFHHILTKAIGTDPSVSPDLYSGDLQHGDRFLLCTDGISDMIEDGELKELLSLSGSPEEICKVLIACGLRNGGHDNMTVLVIDHLP
ncbi:MAG: serine/threonine-protein phosphatase, partial [Chlamydiia bacterium]|nr:serine/threonine-protein phosphatase [Chlamydiia bacterium]